MWKNWIPNGLSLGNLTFGFFSILVSSHAHAGSNIKSQQIFLVAGLLIMIAALFDGLDGPLARKLGVQSPLGEQLDSLGDLTTFGLAPGALIYQMYLSDLRIPLSFSVFPTFLPLGLAISAIFPICAAYRLARFNVTHDNKSFVGLPSPVAGLFIAFIPVTAYNDAPVPLPYALALFIAMAILMVSNVKYSKPQATLKPHFTIVRLIAFAALVGFLMYLLGWYWVIFFVVVLYIFSGLLAFFIHLLQRIRVGFDKRFRPGERDNS